MEKVAKKILNYIGNTHTKVEKKEGFMGNYYSHLIDTMYIAENFENKEMPAGVKNINKKAAELVVVCHECIHSTQSKCIHLLNTLFSNLSIVLSVVYVMMALLWTNYIWLKIVTAIIIVASIVLRITLEIGAINNSIKLASEIVNNKIIEGISQNDIEESIKYINKHKIMAVLQMITDKIVFLILVLIIK